MFQLLNSQSTRHCSASLSEPIGGMHTYSAMSDSLQPCGMYPARLLYPWGFSGKGPGVAGHSLLHGVIPIQGSNPSLLHWQADSLPSEPTGKYFIYSSAYISVPNSMFIPPFSPGNLSSVSGNQESGFQHLFPTLYPLTHRYDSYVGKTLRILRGCFHYETHRVPGILLPVPCLRGRPLWAFWLA